MIQVSGPEVQEFVNSNKQLRENISLMIGCWIDHSERDRVIDKIMYQVAHESLDARVRLFHRTMGQEVREFPSVPSEKIVRLRARLVLEETLELVQAIFGAHENDVHHYVQGLREGLKLVIDEAPINVSMPALADALADIDYVVSGTRAAFGIDGRPIADAVHAANMAKAGGPRRADGKVLKPEGWKPADIAALLKEQGRDSEDHFANKDEPRYE